MLRVASEASGIPIDIIAQGDNCIVQIFADRTKNMLDPETQLERNSDVDLYREKLNEICKGMEVKLKIEES